MDYTFVRACENGDVDYVRENVRKVSGKSRNLGFLVSLRGGHTHIVEDNFEYVPHTQNFAVSAVRYARENGEFAMAARLAKCGRRGRKKRKGYLMSEASDANYVEEQFETMGKKKKPVKGGRRRSTSTLTASQKQHLEKRKKFIRFQRKSATRKNKMIRLAYELEKAQEEGDIESEREIKTEYEELKELDPEYTKEQKEHEEYVKNEVQNFIKGGFKGQIMSVLGAIKKAELEREQRKQEEDILTLDEHSYADYIHDFPEDTIGFDQWRKDRAEDRLTEQQEQEDWEAYHRGKEAIAVMERKRAPGASDEQWERILRGV